MDTDDCSQDNPSNNSFNSLQTTNNIDTIDTIIDTTTTNSFLKQLSELQSSFEPTTSIENSVDVGTNINTTNINSEFDDIVSTTIDASAIFDEITSTKEVIVPYQSTKSVTCEETHTEPDIQIIDEKEEVVQTLQTSTESIDNQGNTSYGKIQRNIWCFSLWGQISSYIILPKL